MPTDDPAAQAGSASKLRYDFPTIVFDTLPVWPSRSGHIGLPFRARWTALAVEIERDEKPRGFYVPAAYFVEARGAKADKVDHAYVKQKLSDEWRKWSTEVPAAKRGQRFELVKTNRKGDEEDCAGQGLGVFAVVKLKG